MKHLLVNPYSQAQEWCKEYFPDRSLGMMPVAGRCAAEYFIDLALRCEAESLLLLGPAYNEHLAEHLQQYQQGALALGGLVASWVGGVLKATPRLLVLAVLGLMACFYFSMDYERICAFLQTGLPPRLAGAVARVRTGAGRVLRRYLRAYGLLWLLTFGEVLVGLMILRRPYSVLIALAVATVDLLPIVGAGSVLIPWAAVLFLLGKPAVAVGLLILYGVLTLVRQIAEPYLVGESLGIPPVVSLLCMALGLLLFGFGGMLLGPVTALAVKELWSRERRAGEIAKKDSPDRR